MRLQLPAVGELLRKLEDGSMSLDDVAAEFARWDWSISVMSDEAHRARLRRAEVIRTERVANWNFHYRDEDGISRARALLQHL